jgi:hypothetical protein
MIVSVTLVVLVIAVAGRVRQSWRKPAWWATAFGFVGVATYGFFAASPALLDRALGGQNTLTLVRDAAAVAAMWFFHNAVAAQRMYQTRHLPWWGLCLAIASFAVPFAFIHEPGPTSQSFVLDRLDQFPVWLFSTVYTALMGTLAGRTIAMLASKRTTPTKLWVTGLSLMLVSDILEVGYLAIAHFGDVGAEFRERFYYVAQLPFFSGVIIAVVGFIWIIVTLSFWWVIARWTLHIDSQVKGLMFLQLREQAVAKGKWTNRQVALDSAADIRDRVKLGHQRLTPLERVIFTVVERMLSNQLKKARA